MIEPIETIEYKDHLIKVLYDESPMNPIKDWDCMAQFACWHNRYNLGNYDTKHIRPTELLDMLKETKAVFLPLYLYDHSGITISTGAFSCPWDSGQIGYVFRTRENILNSWSWKKLTPNRIKKIQEYLRQDVETYDDYLTGNVFGYQIEKMDNNDGEHEDGCEDSCWGFFGDEGKDQMIEEAKSNIDYWWKKHLKNKRKENALIKKEEGMLAY